MPHYKDTNNNLHFIDDASFAHYLPSGSIEINDEEANQIRIKNLPKANRANEIKAELNRIDSESIRALRALLIPSTMQNEFDIRKLQSLEQQAAALRTELNSIQ